jgi:hypothetical protein
MARRKVHTLPRPAARLTGARKFIAALKALPNTGDDGFEGFVRDCLEEVLGHHFRLMKSGHQDGGDGANDPFANALAIAFEGKKFGSAKVSLAELRRKIHDAVDNMAALDLWVLATTTGVSQGDLVELYKTGEKLGIAIAILDGIGGVDETSALGLLAASAPGAAAKHLGAADGVADYLAGVAAGARFADLRDAVLEPFRRSDVGYGAAREAAAAWIERAVADDQSAVAHLHCHGGISDPSNYLVPRERVNAQLDAWWQSGPSEPLALLGDEGVGKTWSLLAWWQAKMAEAPELLPLTIVVPARGLGDMLGERPERLLARLLADRNPTRDADFWYRRIGLWMRKPALKPSILLVVDGLNQDVHFLDWQRLVQPMLVSPLVGHVAIAFTCRTAYWDDDLKALANMKPPALPLSVGDFSDEELDAMLAHYSVSRSELSDDLVKLMRVPRYCQLAIRLRRELEESGDITIERLIYEDWRQRLKLHGSALHPTVEDFHRFLAEEGARLRAAIADESDSRQHLTRAAIVQALGAESGAGHLDLQTALSEIISGGWVDRVPGNSSRFRLKKERVGFALALALVDQLDAAGAARAERLAEFMEPLRGTDRGVEILRWAVTVTMLRDHGDRDIFLLLAEDWFFQQNFGTRDYQTLNKLIPAQPDLFLDLAERIWRSRHQSARDENYFITAFANAAQFTPFCEALARRLVRWLGSYDVDSIQLKNAEYGADRALNAEIDAASAVSVAAAPISSGTEAAAPAAAGNEGLDAPTIWDAERVGRERTARRAAARQAVSQRMRARRAEWDSLATDLPPGSVPILSWRGNAGDAGTAGGGGELVPSDGGVYGGDDEGFDHSALVARALGILSMLPRAPFGAAFVAWAAARAITEAKGYHDAMGWVLRINPLDGPETEQLLLGLSQQFIDSDTAVGNDAARLLLEALATPAATAKGAALPAGEPPFSFPRRVMVGEGSVLKFAEDPVDRSDEPLFPFTWIKDYAYRLDISLSPADQERLAEAAAATDPLSIFPGSGAQSSSDYSFEEAIPALARWAPEALTDLVRRIFASAADRDADESGDVRSGLHGLAMHIEKFWPLLDDDAHAKLATAVTPKITEGLASGKAGQWLHAQISRLAGKTAAEQIALFASDPAGPNFFTDEVAVFAAPTAEDFEALRPLLAGPHRESWLGYVRSVDRTAMPADFCEALLSGFATDSEVSRIRLFDIARFGNNADLLRAIVSTGWSWTPDLSRSETAHGSLMLVTAARHMVVPDFGTRIDPIAWGARLQDAPNDSDALDAFERFVHARLAEQSFPDSFGRLPSWFNPATAMQILAEKRGDALVAALDALLARGAEHAFSFGSFPVITALRALIKVRPSDGARIWEALYEAYRNSNWTLDTYERLPFYGTGSELVRHIDLLLGDAHTDHALAQIASWACDGDRAEWLLAHMNAAIDAASEGETADRLARAFTLGRFIDPGDAAGAFWGRALALPLDGWLQVVRERSHAAYLRSVASAHWSDRFLHGNDPGTSFAALALFMTGADARAIELVERKVEDVGAAGLGREREAIWHAAEHQREKIAKDAVKDRDKRLYMTDICANTHAPWFGSARAFSQSPQGGE